MVIRLTHGLRDVREVAENVASIIVNTNAPKLLSSLATLKIMNTPEHALAGPRFSVEVLEASVVVGRRVHHGKLGRKM